MAVGDKLTIVRDVTEASFSATQRGPFADNSTVTQVGTSINADSLPTISWDDAGQYKWYFKCAVTLGVGFGFGWIYGPTYEMRQPDDIFAEWYWADEQAIGGGFGIVITGVIAPGGAVPEFKVLAGTTLIVERIF